MSYGKLFRVALFAVTLASMLASGLFPSSAEAGWPSTFDVRGPDGVPKGTALRKPTAAQLAALAALEKQVGSKLTVQYNGLTATPRHLFSRGSYLTAASTAPPESIARDFLARNRAIFRLGERELASLKLVSRATIPDIGTTVLLFEQQTAGAPVYKGEVLVNVNRAGRVMSVGGDSFPGLAITNDVSITPEQAVSAAAAGLGVSGFAPRQKGTAQMPVTFGDLPHEFAEAPLYDGGGVFTDDIAVERVVFPLGDTGRAAYRLTLTTPQFNGIVWESVVDAQTAQVLRRISLTSSSGPGGGGQGVGRLPTFRPDVQDLVESFNHPTAPTAAAKVFDGAPTTLSGVLGFGRSTAPGTPPTYGDEAATTIQTGRSFKQSQVFARNANPLVYGVPFGQVTRGIPDAQNPTSASPFGWFYLPTDDGGAEIAAGNAARGATRAYGYSMTPEAKTRNLPANSPAGDGDQPYSATVTPLAGGVTLKDGRNLPAVIESNYTEGNNVNVADDRANNNETTHGIRGYSPDRQFTAGYFDYAMGYEYGGVNAGGSPFFPASSNPDVYPAALTLFYYNNIMHDYLYSIGFTESLWNFQQDNFGKGGAANDGVSAQVHDGSGTNNANFSTPADGSRPRMQMYLFTENSFRRSDGDFDFDVVAHEFYHGVSNRSAGKGRTGCLGVAVNGISLGESGGQGEGWSDTIAQSLMDDDATGEFATGEYDRGIRFIPVTNFRYSYGAINGRDRNRRDHPAPPDSNQSTTLNTASVPPTGAPFQVHYVGTIFSAMTWDMRELLIMKQKVDGTFPGVFFDGARRLGGGTPFYIGERLVNSVDARHPIDYRESFNTTTFTQSNSTVNGTPTTPQLVLTPTIKAGEHIVRPGLVAQEIATEGDRQGPLSTAVARGARLADTLVLRGLQLGPCQPSIVDTRDAILLADRELTGGENQSVIWRAFASHGVGLLAASTAGSGNDQSTVPVTGPQLTTAVPVVVEDFTVPLGVTQCEQLGPIPTPAFALSNPSDNKARIVINGGTPIPNAATYLIRRGDSADGPFTQIAEIPASQTTYDDNNLPPNRTYFYQVRATRSDGNPVAPAPNRDCVSSANTQSVLVAGVAINLFPVFAGVDRVDDPRDGSRLIVSWLPATSLNANAQIVYDVYRVPHVEHGDGTQEPTFTPGAGNQVASGLTGLSFEDKGRTLAQAYYYIVQARDTNTGTLDTGNVGNRVTKFNAPTVPQVAGNAPFPLEDFETNPPADTDGGNARFTPALTESGGNPNQNSATMQRVTGATLGGLPTVGKMYAPNFSPCHELTPANCSTLSGGGGASDFSAVIGPLTLTGTSILEFDHAFNQEAFFDGGVLEASVGDPDFQGSTPYPNNTTVFDLGNYIIEGGYNSKLDGSVQPPAPVRGSVLQGRRAYTGVKVLHRVRATLRNFAPGGLHNPDGEPVYVRFRMTSDVATANGVDAGWYVDNVVVHNLACLVNVAAATAGAIADATSTSTARNYDPAGAINGDRKGLDWENGGGWNDATRGVWPDALEITLSGTQAISEVRVYTLQNNFHNPVEPTPDMKADYYGITDFDIQYWTGTAWVTVPGGAIRGNDRVMRTVVFPEVTTTKFRINVLAARNHYSRIVEVEAFGCGSGL